MKHNIVLIVCMDQEYISSVEYDLASVLGMDYVLETIDDTAYLEEYLKSSHRIDTLIIDEELAGEFCQKQNPAHVYQLSEGDESSGKINKYAGSQGIVQALGDMYLLKDTNEQAHLTHLINVVSVSGGAGKTVTALGTAYWLSRQGYKTLYVDAEDFQTYDQILGCSTGDEACDRKLASAMRDCSKESIENIIQADFMDYIRPFHGIPASYGIEISRYYELVNILVESSDYDYIVLEHGAGVISGAIMRQILAGDRLIIAATQSANSIKRLTRFLENIGQYSGQSFIVCGRYIKDRPDYLQDPVIDDDIPIAEYIPEADKELTMKDIFERKLLRDTAEAVV